MASTAITAKHTITQPSPIALCQAGNTSMSAKLAIQSTLAPMAAARPRTAVGKTSPWISQPVPPTPIANEVMTALRRANDAQWLILHNRSLSGTASGRVALTGTPRHAALYDPAGGGYRPVGHTVADGRLVIDVVLPPYALWCVRLSDELPPLQKVPAYQVTETPPLTRSEERETKNTTK